MLNKKVSHEFTNYLFKSLCLKIVIINYTNALREKKMSKITMVPTDYDSFNMCNLFILSRIIIYV